MNLIQECDIQMKRLVVVGLVTPIATFYRRHTFETLDYRSSEKKETLRGEQIVRNKEGENLSEEKKKGEEIKR